MQMRTNQLLCVWIDVHVCGCECVFQETNQHGQQTGNYGKCLTGFC